MRKTRGCIKVFCQNVFVSDCEKIRRGTLYGVTDFGYRNFLCLKGLCFVFLSIFFVSQCPKILQGNRSVLCFGKFPVAKKFLDEKDGAGEYQKFLLKTFCLTVPKKIVEKPCSVSLISGIVKICA